MILQLLLAIALDMADITLVSAHAKPTIHAASVELTACTSSSPGSTHSTLHFQPCLQLFFVMSKCALDAIWAVAILGNVLAQLILVGSIDVWCWSRFFLTFLVPRPQFSLTMCI